MRSWNGTDGNTAKGNTGKALEKKADRTPEEEDMLDMMLHGGERVRIQNLQGVISWYNGKR